MSRLRRGKWFLGQGAWLRAAELLRQRAWAGDLRRVRRDGVSSPRVMKLMERAKTSDTVLFHDQPIAVNFEFVRRNGIEKWAAREEEKITFLKTLLADYNDGRSKTFYCLSVQLLPLDKLKPALAQAQKR